MNKIYNILRFIMRLAIFPIMFVIWIIATPIVIVLSFIEDESYNSFIIDLKLWVDNFIDMFKFKE